jgi:hypothetical protein
LDPEISHNGARLGENEEEDGVFDCDGKLSIFVLSECHN